MLYSLFSKNLNWDRFYFYRYIFFYYKILLIMIIMSFSYSLILKKSIFVSKIYLYLSYY